ncbi:MAG: hypothetical protein WAT19_14020 [Ferruginibacter sp.]
MKQSVNHSADFFEGSTYHVYGRTNNKELLFKSDENYLYFLRQFSKYLQPFVDTFCWCLLPNHFHFLIRVKQRNAIVDHLLANDKLLKCEQHYLGGNCTADELIGFEWRRFLTSYSMAFNRQYNRTGNLLNRPFRRVLIDDDTYFTQVAIYIHANAQRHKLCKDFKDYKWTSWHSIISDKPTQLYRSEILEWFGGIERLGQHHIKNAEYYYETKFTIEED